MTFRRRQNAKHTPLLENRIHARLFMELANTRQQATQKSLSRLGTLIAGTGYPWRIAERQRKQGFDHRGTAVPMF